MPSPPARKEVWLALRADGESGTGKADDPWDVSGPALFSSVMNNNIGENTTIHIGPGIFQTYGLRKNDSKGWSPKSGQRIVGASMTGTVLKLVDFSDIFNLTVVIGSDLYIPPPEPPGQYGIPYLLDGFTLENLTLDCNMRAHQGTLAGAGGVAIAGRRVRMRRVRVVDHGTEGGYTKGVECFGMSIAGSNGDYSESSDNIIDDCLMDHPSTNTFYSTSCMLCTGGEASDGYLAFHRNYIIRRCLINCEHLDRPTAIARVTYSQTGSSPSIDREATVTTKTPHGRAVGDWIVLTGALLDASEDNPFNGSYQITRVDDDTTFRYAPYYSPSDLMRTEPYGDMWIGKRHNFRIYIKRDGGVSKQTGTSEWTITVITDKPHLRIPGQNVAVNGVTIDAGILSTVLNNPHRITDVVDPVTLKFVVTTDPGTPETTQPADANIGFQTLGLSGDAGSGTRLDRNRVYSTELACYHDTGSTIDLSIRKNHFFNVLRGVFHLLGRSDSIGNRTPHAGSSLTRIRTGTTTFEARFTSATPHLLSNGDHVTVRGAIVGASYSDTYNQSNIAVTRVDDYTFGYALPSDPGVNASGFPVFFLGSFDPPTESVERDSADPSGLTAKFTRPSHGFAVGQIVSVFDAVVDGKIDNPFNGAVKITAVSTNTFKYTMAAAPDTTAAVSARVGSKLGTPLVGFGLTPTSTTRTARMNTLRRHTLSKGDVIVIDRANVTGAGAYEGAFAITDVPSPTTFEYQLDEEVSANAAATAQCGALWQVVRHIIEKNVIDLLLNLTRQGNLCVGIALDGRTSSPHSFTFREMTARSNYIRTRDGLADLNMAGGIQVTGCEKALFENNIIGIASGYELLFKSSNVPTFLANQTFAGLLTQGMQDTRPAPVQALNELGTDVDTASLLAM